MPMSDTTIEIVVTTADGEVIKKTAHTWESAEENLGKLERAYKEITKEDE